MCYGPASALYGADAFSAVINIISKDATESAGMAVATSVGAFGLLNQTASYGTALGANASLVVAGQFLYDRQPDLSRYYPADFGGMQAQRTGTFPTIFGPMTPDQAISPDYHIPLSAHSMQATLRAGGFQVTLFENRSHLPSTAGVYTPDNVVYNDVAFNQNELFVGSGTYTRTFGRVTSTSTLTLSRHELNPHSGYWICTATCGGATEYRVRLDDRGGPAVRLETRERAHADDRRHLPAVLRHPADRRSERAAPVTGRAGNHPRHRHRRPDSSS